MSDLFHHTDPFQVIPGDAPIVVGAPHHGTRRNVKADRETGSIALALAEKLGAGAVIVHDLRHTVDVNKNPHALGARVRHHAMRYQNALFEQRPRLVIEIHGHVTGNYAVEVSSGFDLRPDVPEDARYLAALDRMKREMPAVLAARIGWKPTVGVYPLDRDVKKPATNTFTFQKVRRARRLAALAWYGLHIELDASLRTAERCRAPGYVDALAAALAAAIQPAFDPLLADEAGIALPSAPVAVRSGHFPSDRLPATQATGKHATEWAVVVHPSQLESLRALEGDTVIVEHHGEEVRCPVVVSRAVRPGHVAIPARMRRQIGLGRRGRVTVGRAVRSAPATAAARTGRGVVVCETRPGHRRHIWLSPGDVARLGLPSGEPVTLRGQPNTPALSGVTWAADDTLPARFAALSEPVTDRLLLTLGEVVTCDRG
jgi:hypothetical protein